MMVELVKEWYMQKGTLDGVMEHYPFITEEEVAKVQAMIDKANVDVLKDASTMTEYDKIVAVYSSYISHEKKAGFNLETSGGIEGVTVGEVAYIKRMDESQEIAPEIKDAVLKCSDVDILGLEFVEDKEVKEPYICGSRFYVKRKPTKSQLDKLPREAFKQASTLHYYMTSSKRKAICAAMNCFMGEDGDASFQYLTNLTRQSGLTVRDMYESMGFQYVDRISLYDKYNIFPVLVGNGDAIRITSHRLDKPVIIKSADKLFLNLVVRDVEGLSAEV